MEGQVAVRIKALAKIPYGEDLLVCGSVPQLGSWKLCDAAQMHCEAIGGRVEKSRREEPDGS
ncbi:Nipped-B-like protein B [Durusdinium trenchii]|uniref:Nipped-B-like protein B n=1 Tax=Durusdinium trenchii TaxID=1381693 RepID=A0ABP0NXN6_9DINO